MASGAAVRRSAIGRLRVDPRFLGILSALILLTLMVGAVQVSYGDYPIPILEVWRRLLGLGGDDATQITVIWMFRVPRIALAILVGSARNVAGAIMQGLTRNSLAAPDILGVSAGAAGAVIGWLIIAPGSVFAFRPVAAFFGGMATAVLIYFLAWRGGASPLRLILVGIGIGALTSTVSSLVLLIGEYEAQRNMMVWLSGRVSITNWDQIRLLTVWTATLIGATILLARHLNTVSLGQEVATGLGVPFQLMQVLFAAISVALAAGTVAIAGLIGFVGLMGPHIARHLVGGQNARVVPTAALTGGLLVLAADLLGRLVGGTSEVPAGIITSVIGAPIFFLLLARGMRL